MVVICSEVFFKCGLREIRIPDQVTENLCDKCFYACKNLSRVTFGDSSSLKRIGRGCFRYSDLIHTFLPSSVASVGGSAFSECPLSDHFCSLLLIAFCSAKIHVCYNCIGQPQEIAIPDSVDSICDGCFSECESLSCVTFGRYCALKRIGIDTLSRSKLTEIHHPESIEELYDNCFHWCSRLARVTLGASLSLKRIGMQAFSTACMVQIHIPDSIEELDEKCFCQYCSLSTVTFGESSSLKRIGADAFFHCTSLNWIYIPGSVAEVGDNGLVLESFICYVWRERISEAD